MVTIKSANPEQYENWVKNTLTDAMHRKYVYRFTGQYGKSDIEAAREQLIFEALVMLKGYKFTRQYIDSEQAEILQSAKETAELINQASGEEI